MATEQQAHHMLGHCEKLSMQHNSFKQISSVSTFVTLPVLSTSNLVMCSANDLPKEWASESGQAHLCEGARQARA